MRLELASELETTQLGRTLAEALVWPFVLFLKGDLGAGKTTLMRGLVQSLGHEGRVKSPTYGIAETYAINEKSCVHMDLYRIASMLTVTSVAPQQRPPEPTGGSSSSEPSLTDAWGNEWATICKSWLDVQECVMAVSLLLV